jgi:TonB family protein
MTTLIAVTGVMLLGHPQSGAFELKLIANTGIKTDTVSSDEIKGIFLLKKNSLRDGTHVEPVLRKAGQFHEAFAKQFLDMNEEGLATYYQTLVFTGKSSMPREFNSDSEVVTYVGRTKGAIGYIEGEVNDGNVKILLLADGEGSSRRRLITHVEPGYPETLKRLGIGGVVKLHISITPKGNVEDVQLLGGNPILAEAAILAVKQWIYSPNHSRTSAEVVIPFDSGH